MAGADGKARPAAEVRKERASAPTRQAGKVHAAELAIAHAASLADGPKTREELYADAGGSSEITRAALKNLIGKGELVEVEQKKPHSKTWKLWTRTRAEAARIAIVADREAAR